MSPFGTAIMERVFRRRRYPLAFYEARHESTIYSANAILRVVLGLLPPIRSAVDIGCGVGTWLSVLKNMGVERIQGVDGDWVPVELLDIPADNVIAANLENPIDLGTRFDLAICLEVAEHLSPAAAPRLVSSLADLSDFVLFSAAIPFQGGKHHVNEQWPTYWVDLFREVGYSAVDLVRAPLWNDAAIPVWYRQNTLIFAKEERLAEVGGAGEQHGASCMPLSVVHPAMWVSRAGQAAAIRGAARLLARAFKASLVRRIGHLG